MTEFSVLSWNIEGKNPAGVGVAFEKILPGLLARQSDIICLQEMPDAKSKLAESRLLSKYYSFIPPLNKNRDKQVHGFNHNILLSKHPIVSAQSLVFPRFSGPSRPYESAIKADIQINNKILRLYVCHLMIEGVGIVGRLRQIEHILADAIAWSGPIIICGDMNAAMPKNAGLRKVVKWWHSWPGEEMLLGEKLRAMAEKEILFQKIKAHGFLESLDLNKPTWSPFRAGWWEMLKLKLDWFLVKNLQAVQVDLGEYVSDHRPISALLKIH